MILSLKIYKFNNWEDKMGNSISDNSTNINVKNNYKNRNVQRVISDEKEIILFVLIEY